MTVGTGYCRKKEEEGDGSRKRKGGKLVMGTASSLLINSVKEGVYYDRRKSQKRDGVRIERKEGLGATFSMLPRRGENPPRLR